jgi:hypothetical protein
MSDAIQMPCANRQKGRRRMHPLPGVPQADVVSLSEYRDEASINSALASVQDLQRESHVHIDIDSTGKAVCSQDFNPLHVEQLVDHLLYMIVKARIAKSDWVTGRKSD